MCYGSSGSSLAHLTGCKGYFWWFLGLTIGVLVGDRSIVVVLGLVLLCDMGILVVFWLI